MVNLYDPRRPAGDFDIDANGLVTCIPAATGNFQIIVVADDQQGGITQQTLTLPVQGCRFREGYPCLHQIT